MAKWIAAALLALVAAQDNKFGNSYKGKTPPEIVAAKDQWFNAADGLQLGKLKGKVVWLEFGFLKCAPCRKMMPVMDKWHKEFGEKGLVVLDVDDGSVDDLDEVKKDVAEKGTKYAVLWDKDRKNCDAYGVEVFPRAYLIGVDGTVLWEGIPNDKLDEIEK
ncbi:MAG: TlpA family protein disulfide reductase, partial [Planctomycetaceae bacterium]|nr:TlpA family protein disulfide reductase [Planctomycetaceae bacterium]